MRIKLAFILFLQSLLLTALAQQNAEIKPFQLAWTHKIYSQELAENRTLNIYLPEGYSEKDSVRYPVIYLLDGSADEDFIHTAGLVQFYNFPWINMLPPSILVGIANVDRRRDFTFPTTIEKDKADFPTTGKSAAFIDFLEKEVQPYIKKQFKTNERRMIIGQSLGGLLATEILFRRPAMFDQYLIVSPSLWWDKESLLRISRQPVHDSTQVYIAVGEEGKVMKNDARSLYKSLKATFRSPQNIRFDFLKKEDHATIFHKAMMNAFEAWAKK